MAALTTREQSKLFLPISFPVQKIVPKKDAFTFVDLFSGIGGFHLALRQLGGECLFASEIDQDAVFTYKQNFDTLILGDIEDIDEKSLPEFDFLCAGFPCQPFSKGGHRQGFEDTRGTLFFEICRLARQIQPKCILLENVANLIGHDDGRTYQTIIETLQELGYRTPSHPLVLSPDMFGVPVHRPRIYIPCIRKDVTYLKSIDLLFNKRAPSTDVYSLIDSSQKSAKYSISTYEKRILDMWNEFYKGIDMKVIGFPVWAEEFGSDKKFSHFPTWKRIFIQKNRDLYTRNKKFVDRWLKKHDRLSWCNPTHRKFEWQAGDSFSDIYECLIQFRPSGVRARRPNRFSTLVAMNHPQIIGKYERRLTPSEAKRLQSFPDSYKLHQNDNIALRQLGNAVNVKVVKSVAAEMLKLISI